MVAIIRDVTMQFSKRFCAPGINIFTCYLPTYEHIRIRTPYVVIRSSAGCYSKPTSNCYGSYVLNICCLSGFMACVFHFSCKFCYILFILRTTMKHVNALLYCIEPIKSTDVSDSSLRTSYNGVLIGTFGDFTVFNKFC